mgnify:CR=1 FL=1
MPTDAHKNTTKNAAQKGRIEVRWVAELFFRVFYFFNLTTEELTAELCWPVPA